MGDARIDFLPGLGPRENTCRVAVDFARTTILEEANLSSSAHLPSPC